MATHSSVLFWKIPWTKGAWWATVYGVAEFDVDFALAHWVETDRLEIKFDWFDEDGFCDVVAGVTAPFDITLNGQGVSSSVGIAYQAEAQRGSLGKEVGML